MRNQKTRFSIFSILLARCPSCHTGGVLKGVFSTRARCPDCGYDLYPEPGFYLGAMMVGFLVSAILTVPPIIALKLLDADLFVLLAVPFVEFFFVATFLMFYSRVLWLHIEYQITERLDGHAPPVATQEDEGAPPSGR